MSEYNVIPEFSHGKIFPVLSVVYLCIALGFLVFGVFVASMGFIPSYIFLFCSLYYGGLSLCKKFYRLNVSSSVLTVWNIINKSQSYHTDKLRWRIGRIPWYNSYYILIYATKKIPIAVVRPHWKNALRVLKFPHWGKMLPAELEYLKFLKSIGML